jgi:hypothetical protein
VLHTVRWSSVWKSVVVLGAALAIPSAALAQMPQQAAPKKTPSTAKFDPHDLSGVWNAGRVPLPHAEDYRLPRADNPGGGGGVNYVPKEIAENNMTPWARQYWLSQDGGKGQGGLADPLFNCDPVGFPRVLVFIHPWEIVQEPGKTWMIYEANHMWRVIYTDGRPVPKTEDLPFGPTWMGYSVGHWNGNDFVVDTIGMNDKTWLDQVGHVHSEDLHLTEDYKRTDHDTLEMSLTFDDPKAYTKSWTYGPRTWALQEGPQWEIQESFCTLAEQQVFKDTEIKIINDQKTGKGAKTADAPAEQ